MRSDFFSFSRLEKYGIWLLFILSLLVLLLPKVYAMISINKRTDDAQFIKEKTLLSDWLQSNESEVAATQETNGKISINEINYQQLKALGIDEKLIKTFLSFRKMSGGFKSEQDISKVYGMNQNTMDLLKEATSWFSSVAAYQENQPTRGGLQQMTSSSKYNLKAFDPNTATEEELISLGIPTFTSKVIVKYISKGGKFKSADELSKIHSMTPELLEKLKPYIVISTPTPTSNTAAFIKNEVEKPTQISTNPQIFAKKSNHDININTATIDDWMSLKGIGKSYAQRIIDYKNKLGGFYDINQVAEVSYFPDSVFQSIKPFLKNTDYQNYIVNKININTATVEELDKHYLINNKEAKAIVNYRNQHGNYKSVNDLKQVIAINSASFEKFKNYIKVD
ncbi:MAG: helix-hairpin-helix domain-containing protein [Saprospiraceae bacterium]|nr:helix-hairpin-helix domain-containing protein [Saprospiraceae bacterium]